MFVLVPDLYESVAFAGCRKQRPIGTKRHMVNRRSRMTFPHALPSLILSVVLLIGGRFWIAATDFEFH